MNIKANAFKCAFNVVKIPERVYWNPLMFGIAIGIFISILIF